MNDKQNFLIGITEFTSRNITVSQRLQAIEDYVSWSSKVDSYMDLNSVHTLIEYKKYLREQQNERC